MKHLVGCWALAETEMLMKKKQQPISRKHNLANKVTGETILFV
jgi:hypothetical protein